MSIHLDESKNSLIVLETRGPVLLIIILLTEQVSSAWSDLSFPGLTWPFGMDACWSVSGKTRMWGKRVWSLTVFFFLLEFLHGFWEELNLFIYLLQNLNLYLYISRVKPWPLVSTLLRFTLVNFRWHGSYMEKSRVLLFLLSPLMA